MPAARLKIQLVTQNTTALNFETSVSTLPQATHGCVRLFCGRARVDPPLRR